IVSAYFMLERFYASGGTRFLASAGSDLYGGWQYDYSRNPAQLDSALEVDDDICHRLEQLQDAFIGEWLFYRDDPRAVADSEAYSRDEIALGAVNIRHRRIAKLSRLQAVWTFYSKDFERQVLELLLRRWPLDYKGD
ncbi:MAG: hypothetical protein ACREUQ_04490, partial [Burkholderiales bacterium]